MSFEDFWAAYKRKIEKPLARKAYEAALKIATHEEIMEGLERYNTLGPGAGEKQYIIYPERWLKRERWCDEYEDDPIEKPFDQRRHESDLYVYVKTGEWRGADNTKPTREQAIERLRDAGGWEKTLNELQPYGVIEGGRR